MNGRPGRPAQADWRVSALIAIVLGVVLLVVAVAIALSCPSGTTVTTGARGR